MRATVRMLLLLAFVAVLADCSHEPRKRVNPPVASLQELAVQPDGQWQLKLRLQNFSDVAMTFSSIQGRLVVAGEDAGGLDLSPGLTIGPGSAEILPASLAPTLAAKTTVAAALASGQPVAYVLDGQIASSEPKRKDKFHYESSLSPAPGLRGVMR